MTQTLKSIGKGFCTRLLDVTAEVLGRLMALSIIVALIFGCADLAALVLRLVR